jgi:hypothetical protein
VLDEEVRSLLLSEMRPPFFLGFIAGLAVVLSFAGCEKKSGEAVVLEKEHIAAMETPPKNEQTASPTKSATNDDAQVTKMGKNVQADQACFEKLKEGDRVKVSYRIGKYTGTVWDSEIR